MFSYPYNVWPGTLESVYEEMLSYELLKCGLFIFRQKVIEVVHEEIKMDKGFKADLIVENKVIIELKAVEHILTRASKAITYLKLTGMKLGLLINFDVALIKDGIQRIVNKL